MGSVSLQGIRKAYGPVEVIRGVDLDVHDGEFMVFVGPSGCGKSTLLRMIAGLEGIDAGELRIDGQRANDTRPADRGAAMVFQSYALYPHMTVAQNMGFALRMAGVTRTQRDEQVARAAEALRIGNLLQRYPKELSGGQRQRVAIGRAIVRKPKVFLFDEPLSNLDAALRVDMRIELSRLHQELGTTMIYVTHDQVEAMTLGDRIAIFRGGVVEQLGAPLALYQQPANAFVAGFLGAPRINLVGRPDTAAPPAWRRLWDTLVPPTLTQAHTVGVRAEDLSVGTDAPGVPARVELAEHLGDSAILYLRVEGLPELLRARAFGASAALSAGAAATLRPDVGHALVFDAQGRRLPKDAPA